MLLELAKVTSSLNVLKAQNTELVRKLATARIEAHEELLSGPAPHGGLPSTTLDKQKVSEEASGDAARVTHCALTWQAGEGSGLG